jgi:hypothetical protein
MVLLDGTSDSASRKPIMTFQHSEGKRPLRTMEICFALRRGDNLSETFRGLAKQWATIVIVLRGDEFFQHTKTYRRLAVARHLVSITLLRPMVLLSG